MTKREIDAIRETLDKEVPCWIPDYGIEEGECTSTEQEIEAYIGDDIYYIYVTIRYSSSIDKGDYYTPSYLNQRWDYKVTRVEAYVGDERDAIVEHNPGIEGTIMN